MKPELKVGDIVEYSSGDQYEIVGLNHGGDNRWYSGRGIRGTSERPYGSTSWWKLSKESGNWTPVSSPAPEDPKPICTIVPEYLIEVRQSGHYDEKRSASGFVNEKIKEGWEFISATGPNENEKVVITMVKFHEHYEFGDDDDT